MKILSLLICLSSFVAFVTESSSAVAEVSVFSKSDLRWKDMGNGIMAAQVSGDMDTSASSFFLKYPTGLVTPIHHHDTDHKVVLISGVITLTALGNQHKLQPGSYLSLTNKAPHVVKVEGNEDAVLFIQADGPWNVVMDK